MFSGPESQYELRHANLQRRLVFLLVTLPGSCTQSNTRDSNGIVLLGIKLRETI